MRLLRRVALRTTPSRTTRRARPGRPPRSGTGGTTASPRTCRRSGSAARAAAPSRGRRCRYRAARLRRARSRGTAHALERVEHLLLGVRDDEVLQLPDRLCGLSGHSAPSDRTPESSPASAAGRNLQGAGDQVRNRMAAPGYAPTRPSDLVAEGATLRGRERVVGEEREAQVLVVVDDAGQTGDVVDVRGLRRAARPASGSPARRPVSVPDVPATARPRSIASKRGSDEREHAEQRVAGHAVRRARGRSRRGGRGRRSVRRARSARRAPPCVPAGVDPSPPRASPTSRVNISAVRLSLDVSMLATMSASGGDVTDAISRALGGAAPSAMPPTVDAALREQEPKLLGRVQRRIGGARASRSTRR